MPLSRALLLAAALAVATAGANLTTPAPAPKPTTTAAKPKPKLKLKSRIETKGGSITFVVPRGTSVGVQYLDPYTGKNE